MNPKWMPGVAAFIGLALAGPTTASAAGRDPYDSARSRDYRCESYAARVANGRGYEDGLNRGQRDGQHRDRFDVTRRKYRDEPRISLPTVYEYVRSAPRLSRAIETATISNASGRYPSGGSYGSYGRDGTINDPRYAREGQNEIPRRPVGPVRHREDGAGFPPHVLGRNGAPLQSEVEFRTFKLARNHATRKEIAAFKQQLCDAIPNEELRALHERDPRRHLLYAARQFGIVAVCGWALWHLTNPLFWVPLAILQGFTFFNMTTLLHEVVHNSVFRSTRHGWERALGLAYASTSGISASRRSRTGTRPSTCSRRLVLPSCSGSVQLLYCVRAPPLFPRRARQRRASEPSGRTRPTLATMVLQFSVMGALWYFGGWQRMLRIQIVPYFLVFPVAFTLNRLGQHYNIDPTHPLKWATLMKPSHFWDFLFVYSNYHLDITTSRACPSTTCARCTCACGRCTTGWGSSPTRTVTSSGSGSSSIARRTRTGSGTTAVRRVPLRRPAATSRER
jgi:hypothetical protein